MAQDFIDIKFIGDIFVSPSHVIERFEEYITYIEANTLKESKLYGAEGAVARIDKMRMPTRSGFVRYLRVAPTLYGRYEKRGGDWAEAFKFVEESMYAICIEGGAAGLLKESIVSKKIGLADKIDDPKTIRKVIVLHAPDNSGRAISQSRQQNAIDIPHEEEGL